MRITTHPILCIAAIAACTPEVSITNTPPTPAPTIEPAKLTDAEIMVVVETDDGGKIPFRIRLDEDTLSADTARIDPSVDHVLAAMNVDGYIVPDPHEITIPAGALKPGDHRTYRFFYVSDVQNHCVSTQDRFGNPVNPSPSIMFRDETVGTGHACRDLRPDDEFVLSPVDGYQPTRSLIVRANEFTSRTFVVVYERPDAFNFCWHPVNERGEAVEATATIDGVEAIGPCIALTAGQQPHRLALNPTHGLVCPGVYQISSTGVAVGATKSVDRLIMTPGSAWVEYITAQVFPIGEHELQLDGRSIGWTLGYEEPVLEAIRADDDTMVDIVAGNDRAPAKTFRMDTNPGARFEAVLLESDRYALACAKTVYAGTANLVDAPITINGVTQPNRWDRRRCERIDPAVGGTIVFEGATSIDAYDPPDPITIAPGELTAGELTQYTGEYTYLFPGESPNTEFTRILIRAYGPWSTGRDSHRLRVSANIQDSSGWSSQQYENFEIQVNIDANSGTVTVTLADIHGLSTPTPLTITRANARTIGFGGSTADERILEVWYGAAEPIYLACIDPRDHNGQPIRTEANFDAERAHVIVDGHPCRYFTIGYAHAITPWWVSGFVPERDQILLPTPFRVTRGGMEQVVVPITPGSTEVFTIRYLPQSLAQQIGIMTLHTIGEVFIFGESIGWSAAPDAYSPINIRRDLATRIGFGAVPGFTTPAEQVVTPTPMTVTVIQADYQPQ